MIAVTEECVVVFFVIFRLFVYYLPPVKRHSYDVC